MSEACTSIHPSAVIDPGARLGAGVQVGAYAVIGASVEIGDGSRIGAHCTIEGPTRIGRGNVLHAHAAIGGEPQDKKYRGERVELVIGDGNVVREFGTINRGTGDGGGITRIGDRNWILAYSHIAHDCIVGDDCVFSNNATLAGHVVIGNQVILSGFAGVHQFCRIGDHAFIAMGALANGDVTPYTTIGGNSIGRPRGINSEGLRRRGFSPERITAIKRAYRTLFVSGMPLAEAREELARQAEGNDDVRLFLDFIDSGERPLLR